MSFPASADRLPAQPRTGSRCGTRALALLVAHAMLLGTAAGQSAWELSPYRVHLRLAMENTAHLPSAAHQQLATGLAAQLDATVSAAWQLQLTAATGAERHRLLDDLAALSAEDVPDDVLTDDKYIVASVRSLSGGVRVAVREFDCRTRGWGPVVTGDIPQRRLLQSGLARAVLAAFRPTARIDVQRDGSATLQLRAAGLMPRDAGWQPVAVGDVFEPILRRNNREGNPIEGGIQPVPWTFLVVEEIAEGTPQCEVVSGLRSGLSMRRRGRTELFALAATPVDRPTLVQLRSRADETKPLVGYELYARGGPESSMHRLGRTDDAGQFELAPQDVPVLTLFVKHGGEVLGRLPIVPGLAPVVTARLVDDDVRLAVEAELFGLEQDLIDTVARREVLLARTRSRLDANNLAGAEEMLSQLKRLPTRTQFEQQVQQLRNKSGANDPAVQAKVQQLLRKTEEMLGKYLDPAPITALETRFNQASAQQ